MGCGNCVPRDDESTHGVIDQCGDCIFEGDTYNGNMDECGQCHGHGLAKHECNCNGDSYNCDGTCDCLDFTDPSLNCNGQVKTDICGECGGGASVPADCS